jgi:hypothetical protein
VHRVDALDKHEILRRVIELPISSWSYLWDQGDVRHIGPMAQDFHAAFGGARDDRIDIVQGQAVALAAIQALHELVRQQQDEIAELRARIDGIVAAES